MQLNKFTDYALRMVVYISRPSDTPYTVADIARDLQVSQNHMVKIVHYLGKEGLIETTRGKGGGIRLSEAAMPLRLGDVVRKLQGNPQVVECFKPACVFRYNCALKPVLDQALNCFYDHLNQFSIGDVVALMNQQLYGKQPSDTSFSQAIATLSIETSNTATSNNETSDTETSDNNTIGIDAPRR